ncbi:LacI family DNA-binding transcriptional regulator [Brachybacterium alimentarium]|uniref:LacI family DNA-binding transcriptional regulator n=1 Tax=Brachybacterium alimentarium TaxID=47845 RepID=UPI003F932DDD
MRSSTTIRDVAAAAEVSISTVSRTMAHPELVASGTREHVLAIARDLRYRPALGASTDRARPGMLGLVVPDLENPFFGLIAKGVQARARSAGMLVVVSDIEEDGMLERTMLESIASGVDGLILCSPRGDDENILDVARRVPTVTANREVTGVPSVMFDEDRGMTSSLRHLQALGHRRIAYAGGPLQSWTHRRRAQAVHRFAEQESDVGLIDLGSFQPYLSGGLGAADQALAAGVTAIVAFNDLLALGILDRLAQRGVRVPEDMSVTGIDNVSAATYVRPHLTTVDVPRVRMGRTAVDLLLSTMHDGAPAPSPILPAELIVRDSTAVAPVVVDR